MSYNPISVAQGSDGYLTFFTGAEGLAGDNDLFYNRANGTLLVRGMIQGQAPITGAGVGGVGHTGTQFSWDATSNAGATGGIAFRFDTSFQSQTDVYRWRAGGNFTPAGVAFGFFDNVPNIWMKSGTPPLTGFNEVTPVNVVDVGGGMVIGATYAGTNTAPSNGLLVEGNVGLGTTAPQNKLDVEGAAAIGASYSGTSTAPANGLIVEGSVGIGTASPEQTLHVHRGSAGTVTAQSNAILVLENSTQGYIHMLTPHVNEAGLLFGSPDTTIKSAIIGTGSSYLIFRSGGNTTRMVLSPDGNLGIGTGAPHARLTIAGEIALEELANTPISSNVDGYGYFYVKTDNMPYFRNGLGEERFLTESFAGGDGYLAFYVDGNTIAGDNDLYWDRVNNVLGIGIANPFTAATPGATLTIGSPNNGTRINIVAGETQGTNTIGFYATGIAAAFAGISAAHTNKGDGGSGHLSFQTDDGTSHVTRMRILDTGNIGIGTVDPHEALTINGILSLQEQDVYNRNFDGYGSVWVKSDGSLHFRNDAGTDYDLTAAAGLSATQGADGYIAFFTGGNSIAGDNDLYFSRETHTLTLTGGGKFGIGTAAPAYTLHVSSDEDQTTAQLQTKSTSATHSASLQYVGPTDNVSAEIYSYMGEEGYDFALATYTDNVGTISLYTLGNAEYNVVRLAASGNLGVGTYDPHEKLTVNGIISLQEQDNYDRNFDGYGSIWAKSDGTLHFRNDAGTDYDLTAAGGGVTATQGSDGYLAFFTSSGSIAGDNDLFYNRASGQLQITNDGVDTLKITHTGSGSGLHVVDDNTAGILIERTVATTAQWALAVATDGVFLIRDQASGGNSIIAIQKAAPTGSIYIESSGDVGFSTLTPVARLELEDNATANGMICKITQDDHNLYGMVIGNDTFSATDTDGLAMYVDNSGVSVIDARGSASRFSLQIGGTEAIRVLNNRNVGIGTSAPANKLDVEGGMAVGAAYSGTSTAPTNGLIVEGNTSFGNPSPDTSIGFVQSTMTSTSTIIAGMYLLNAGTGDSFLRMAVSGRHWSFGIDNSDSDSLKIGTGTVGGSSAVSDNTSLVITTAGNVGVGGTPVNGKFEVNTSLDEAVVSTAYASTSGVNARGVLQARANGGGVILGMNNTAHSAYTRGGEAMNGAAELITFNAGDAVTKLIIGNVNSSPIHFVVGDTKAATISANRDLGIGTQYPIERLTVNGTVALEEQGSIPATQDGYGKLYTNSTGDLSYVDDGGANIQITHADGYVNWTPSWINVIVKDADTGGDANEHTFPTDAAWTGGSVDTTITGRGIYFNSVNGQFNITKAGVYRFFAQIPWSDSDTNTGNITFRVKKNDGTVVWLFDERWNNSTDVSPKTTVIDFIVEVPAGETLEMTWNPRNTAAVINPLGSWFTIGIEQISM